MFFKLKDVFTLANLVLSLYIVVAAMGDRIEEASLLCVFGWLFDGVDGIVARLTKSANAFGAQFDNLTDLFIYSIAPAFVLFAFCRPNSEVLAFALMAFVIGIGSVRLARFNTRPLDYPGYWIGLPRPAVGLFIVFMLNSRFFNHFHLELAVAPLVILVGLLNLSYLPYRNHKKNFNWPRLVAMYLIVLACIAVRPWGYMWDLALLWMVLYVLSPVLFISSQERRKVATFVAEWKRAAVVPEESS